MWPAGRPATPGLADELPWLLLGTVWLARRARRCGSFRFRRSTPGRHVRHGVVARSQSTRAAARVARVTEQPFDTFREMMHLEPHGPDVFVGESWRYPWGRVYGGQVVAQALSAAVDQLLQRTFVQFASSSAGDAAAAVAFDSPSIPTICRTPCTPTSSAGAPATSRSGTRSIASATGARSPLDVSWLGSPTAPS